MTIPEQAIPADRLALLYHLTQASSSSLDLDKVLTKVMDEVITAVRRTAL
jgi:hypothetical protein